MNNCKITIIVLICILVITSIIGCTTDSPSQTYGYSINHDKAIMIAAQYVPINVVKEASLSTGWRDSHWIIHFYLKGDSTITKNELGWSNNPDATFNHHGILPADTYQLLTITISRKTGDILSLQASDDFLVGPVDSETSKVTSVPIWLPIISTICGLVVGGIIMLLVIQKKGNSA